MIPLRWSNHYYYSAVFSYNSNNPSQGEFHKNIFESINSSLWTGSACLLWSSFASYSAWQTYSVLLILDSGGTKSPEVCSHISVSTFLILSVGIATFTILAGVFSFSNFKFKPIASISTNL